MHNFILYAVIDELNLITRTVVYKIAFRYGEDGLDGMWVENQSMPSMKPTNALFEKEFKLDLSDEK